MKADKATILDFQSERFLLVLICKLPRYFLSSFESTGLSVQIFMMAARYFLLSFESTGLSVQEKKRKIDFQDGGIFDIRS